MKSLMRGYVYWPGMDKDIEVFVRLCRGCQLAARAPPVKMNPWPKTDLPWARLHIDYAGPINGYYYLILVDSLSKWPEVVKCKHPTSRNTISALDEIFSRFGVPRTLVSDNGTAFTSMEFKNFCTALDIEHITTPVCHPRSNGQAEKFVDTFKRALRKNQGMDTEERTIQKFLAIYRVTPNENNDAKMSPAEIMFARKIRSIFDRLLPYQNKKVAKKEEKVNIKKYTSGDKVFFKNFQSGKSYWMDGIIQKRIGKVIYTIKSKKFTCKRHINQIRPRYGEESEKSEEEIPMEVLCDAFNMTLPNSVYEPVSQYRAEKRKLSSPKKDLIVTTKRRSTRERKPVERFSPDPKRRRH